jgi:hypothetical protein
MSARLRASFVAVTVLAAALSASSAAAQERPGLSLVASGSWFQAGTKTHEGVARLKGIGVGGEGALTWGPAFLRGSINWAPLDPDGGPAVDTNYMEAFASLGAELLPGFTLGAGPHIWRYDRTSGTESWSLWELRGRYEAPVVRSFVGAYVEAWGGALGGADGPQPIDNGRGGAAGLIVHPAAGPFGVRLSYSIDQVLFTARRETVERVTLGLSFAYPR